MKYSEIFQRWAIKTKNATFLEYVIPKEGATSESNIFHFFLSTFFFLHILWNVGYSKISLQQDTFSNFWTMEYSKKTVKRKIFKLVEYEIFAVYSCKKVNNQNIQNFNFAKLEKFSALNQHKQIKATQQRIATRKHCQTIKSSKNLSNFIVRV